MKNQYAKKKDRNHNHITAHLEARGWTVQDCSAWGGAGFDVLAWKRHSGIHAIEIKDGSLKPSARKLTKSEERAKLLMGEYWHIIETVNDVIIFNYEHG